MYLPLRVVLHRLTERMLAYKFEVLCGGIHLRPFHIRYNNKDIVAAVVVHASQEHKFGELRKGGWRSGFSMTTTDREGHTIVNTTGIMESFRSCIER